MRACVWVLILGAAPSMGAAPAESAELVLAAKVGYMAEWDFSARLASDPTGGPKSFAGAYRMVHTGICTTGGPEIRDGRMTATADRKSVAAEIAFDGNPCKVTLRRTLPFDGYLDCLNGSQVPIALTALPAEE